MTLDDAKAAGEVSGDCWKMMTVLGSVIVAESLALVKVAKFAWDERMARLNDHQSAQAQINVAKRAAKEKGGSPE